MRVGMWLLGLALACGSAAAQETYYKWTDAAGTVHVSSTPPPGHAAKAVKIEGPSEAQAAAAQPPKAAPPSAGLDAAKAAYRRQSCEAARHDLQVLSQDRMVVSGDDPSAATKLGAEQRAQARLRAQQRISQFCGNGGKP